MRNTHTIYLMKQKKGFYFFRFLEITLILFSMPLFGQLESLGQWRDYSSYNSLISIEKAGSIIYGASTNGVIEVDLSENTIQYLTKIDALSDINLTVIRYDENSKSLIVGYSNGNIDIIRNNKTTNLSDIKTSSIVGDKTINNIYYKDNLAYVSVGFGIVVLDLTRLEVKDSYIIGSSGTYVNVKGITIKNDTIYAATDKGVFKAYEYNNFLNDFNSWSKLTDFPSPNGSFTSIDQIGSKLIVSFDGGSGKRDSIYYNNGSGWENLTSFSGIDIKKLNARNNRVCIIQTDTLTVIDSNLNYNNFFNYLDPYTFAYINDAFFDGEQFWLADNKSSFVKINVNYLGTFYPQFWRGHFKNKSSDIDIVNGHLWGATGYVSGSQWNSTYSLDGIYHYDIANNKWTNYGGVCFPEGCIYDLIGVAVNKNEPDKAYACGFSRFTLGEYKNNQLLNYYDSSNSSLQISLIHNDRFAVADASFDDDNNLWAINSWSSNPLILKTPSNNWYSFYLGNTAKNKIISKLLIDKLNGYKWMIIKDQSMIVYNTGDSPTSNTDDQYQVITSGVGNGDLHAIPTCFAEDLDGEIWIGTEEGITVMYNPLNIFEGGNYDAQRIKIEQDGNVEYLLSTEYITCIEVDGGNRKWIGTIASGVYVVSPDGQELIYHFDFDNSPLYDNKIVDIAIDGLTGEAFILTDGGLLSYRGLATEGGITFKDVYAFPNPVKPDYTGDVVIKGLMRDSDIRITDLSGNIVYAGKSVGGQASWNRKNLDGLDVQSGIYLVLMAGPEGRKKEATKILLLD